MDYREFLEKLVGGEVPLIYRCDLKGDGLHECVYLVVTDFRDAVVTTGRLVKAGKKYSEVVIEFKEVTGEEGKRIQDWVKSYMFAEGVEFWDKGKNDWILKPIARPGWTHENLYFGGEFGIYMRKMLIGI